MNRLLSPIQWIGSMALGTLRMCAEVFSLFYGAMVVLIFVRTRGLRTVFEVGVTQVLFTGVHGLPLVSLATLALGTLIITQANQYLPVEYVVTVSSAIITSNMVPLMVAIVLIGRSGTAICVELATMKLSGELDALHSMGLPLEHFIVLPRLVSGVISAGLLTAYGLAIALGGGYALSKAVGNLPFALDALILAVDETQVIEALLKATLFGGAIVLVSIREGYTVQVSQREIPQATTRAVVRSMGTVIVLHSVISIFF